MEKQQKITRFFSKPLMKQTVKTNRALFLVVVVIMCLMSNVVNFAMSIMGESAPAENAQEAQADFYSYLYVLASYNEMSGAPSLMRTLRMLTTDPHMSLSILTPWAISRAALPVRI